MSDDTLYEGLRGDNGQWVNPYKKKRKKPEDIQRKSDYKQDYKDDYNNPQMGPNQPIPSTPSQSSAHIKISIRLPRGIVTSLTIKKNIIAIWILYRTPLKTDPEQILDLIDVGLGNTIRDDTIITVVTTFVYKCMNDWNKDTGKGLSEFITELMIEDALELDDHSVYLNLMELI